jgi:hypothetical protein
MSDLYRMFTPLEIAAWSFPSDWLTDDHHYGIAKRVLSTFFDELVGCDCNNGMRVYGSGREQGACVECVPLEVGGLKVRARGETASHANSGVQFLCLPAVEVNDE